MADLPVIGGTLWRQQARRGIAANGHVARILERIVEDRPGPAETAALLTRAALALRANLDALVELERIGAAAKEARCRTPSPPAHPLG